jgi:hypothetical protein
VLRHDALTPKRAGVLVDDRPVAGVVLSFKARPSLGLRSNFTSSALSPSIALKTLALLDAQRGELLAHLGLVGLFLHRSVSRGGESQRGV